MGRDRVQSCSEQTKGSRRVLNGQDGGGANSCLRIRLRYGFRNERAIAKCSRRWDEVVIKLSIENCPKVVVEGGLEGRRCRTKISRTLPPHVTRFGAIRKQKEALTEINNDSNVRIPFA